MNAPCQHRTEWQDHREQLAVQGRHLQDSVLYSKCRMLHQTDRLPTVQVLHVPNTTRHISDLLCNHCLKLQSVCLSEKYIQRTCLPFSYRCLAKNWLKNNLISRSHRPWQVTSNVQSTKGSSAELELWTLVPRPPMRWTSIPNLSLQKCQLSCQKICGCGRHYYLNTERTALCHSSICSKLR